MKIAFYKGRKSVNPNSRLFDWLICWKTKSDYSHVEIEFDDGISFSSSLRDGGVRFKQIIFAEDSWDVFEISPEYSSKLLRGWSESSFRKAVCTKFLGTKYDYLGLMFTFIAKIKIQDNSKWWCSEICGFILKVDNYHQLSPIQLFEILKKDNILTNLNK